MKGYRLLIGLFLMGFATLTAQDYEAKIRLGFWADTNNYPDLAPLVRLYKNYIESHPDSIYDNPYWNKAEKEKYEDFDISRNSLFQGVQGAWTASSLYSFFTAHILNIEKRDSVYRIKVMLYNPDADSIYNAYNPGLIQRYYAIRENGEWRLANAFTYDLSNWQTVETKHINYHFPRKELYSKELAKKANDFCDSIIKRFNYPELDQKIEYYICTGETEVGEVLGFDYYIFGWALGKTIQNKIISGNGTVYYPHEFVHFIDEDPAGRGRWISEGFATWLGGSVGKSYEELAKEFANEYVGIDTASYNWAWNCQLNCYTLGALLIDIVHDTKGDDGVLEFMQQPTNNADETMSAIQKVCGWNKKTFKRKWSQKIHQFANKKR